VFRYVVVSMTVDLSCSCPGIAANTMIAKVCSDRNKPNGQFAVAPSAEAVLSFMRDLPIRKVLFSQVHYIVF